MLEHVLWGGKEFGVGVSLMKADFPAGGVPGQGFGFPTHGMADTILWGDRENQAHVLSGFL